MEIHPSRNTPLRGCQERIVAIFKKHFVTVLEKEALHIDTLSTTIVEIKGIMNRRPITALSASSMVYEALTPAHILFPDALFHSSAIVVETANDDDATRMRCQWRRAQSRVNAFWHQWKEAYLTTLHSRTKWRSTHRDLAIDDLVIIVDENVRRGEWKMGRVVSVSGTTNHVRKAEIRRSDRRIVTKDRTKVVLLELDDRRKTGNGS